MGLQSHVALSPRAYGTMLKSKGSWTCVDDLFMSVSTPMLHQYMGECMISIIIININDGINEYFLGYQDCGTNQRLVFGACVKMKETLHARAFFLPVNVIMNHIDTIRFYLATKALAWYI